MHPGWTSQGRGGRGQHQEAGDGEEDADRCCWGLPGELPAENCSINISKDSRTGQSCILSIVNIPQERLLSPGLTAGLLHQAWTLQLRISCTIRKKKKKNIKQSKIFKILVNETIVFFIGVFHCCFFSSPATSSSSAFSSVLSAGHLPNSRGMKDL